MRTPIRSVVFYLLLVQCMLISAVTLLAQDTTKRARIESASFLIDLGMLKQDSLATCHFEFRNSGNSMLVLTDAQPSCPCITLNWIRGPIQPGENGWLDIVFHAETAGPFDKAVWIFSNATDSSGQMQAVELRVRGAVLPGKKPGKMPAAD